MEEAAGKSEVNPAPVRAEERAVAGRKRYLTNIATEATKTISAVDPPITRDLVRLRTPVGTGFPVL